MKNLKFQVKFTTNYHGNYPSIYKKYRQENKVTENIQFENMYEWLSNFKLFKVPKTLITRNPKYIKTPRKIKGLIDKQGKRVVLFIIIIMNVM